MGWLFYPIPRIRVLATLAVSSREGNFILAFRISLIPATWIHLFPLCGLENTADSIPSLPRILRGGNHMIYIRLELEIERAIALASQSHRNS